MNNSTVGEISEQIRGVSYAKKDASAVPLDGYSPVLRANNIGAFGLILDDLVYVPNAKISSKQRVLSNDVIVAASSGSLSVVGKAAQARDGFDGGFGAFCKVLRPGIDVDPHYFGHYFRTPIYRRTVSNLAAGANINNLKNEHLDNLQIPLPPLEEQKRIAGILDAADALRARRRESLAQLDTLLQSTFIEMFGDPVTNPMGWEKKPLSGLLERKPNNGIFRKNPDYIEGESLGVPVVWVKELFKGNDIDTSKSRRLLPTSDEVEKYGLRYGDILFCRSSLKPDGIAFNNVYLGKDGEALFECHLIRMSPKVEVANPLFLSFQLRTAQMRAVLKLKSKTATMTTIDQKALSTVEVVVPPLELQQRFAAFVESVEQQKAAQRAHLEELDTLFACLQQRAFAGELVA